MGTASLGSFSLTIDKNVSNTFARYDSACVAAHRVEMAFDLSDGLSGSPDARAGYDVFTASDGCTETGQMC
jgi:hypothetical protein